METAISPFHLSIFEEREALGPSGIDQILDQGRRYPLAPVLTGGGALIFPHTYLSQCGHHVAACVHALLDSGADQALVLGVLHSHNARLRAAHDRFLEGGDPAAERFYGIQGPGLVGPNDWEGEFSLLNFTYLLEREADRRGVKAPELFLRYPCLAADRPDRVPGIEELERLAKDAAILGTGDLFHHGAAYRPPLPEVIGMDSRGLDLARTSIEECLAALSVRDYPTFIKWSIEARSDWLHTGPVLRHLLGSCNASILDCLLADTGMLYDAPPPNWVAAALIAFHPTTAD